MEESSNDKNQAFRPHDRTNEKIHQQDFKPSMDPGQKSMQQPHYAQFTP